MRALYNPQNPDNSAYIKSIADETIKNPFLNPTYRIMIASYVATSGYADIGISQLEEIIENDPRNLDALELLATYYMQLNKVSESIELRKKIELLDQYNAKNFLALGNIYKTLGDYNNMAKMKIKILEVAPASEESKLASDQLRSN
jgi:tetratricopeptide (TPR) repeat protein